MVEERIFIMTFRWRGGKKGKKNPQTVKFGDRAVLFFAEKRKIKRQAHDITAAVFEIYQRPIT